MSQPIVFERLDALGVRVKVIEDGSGGGGPVTIPVGSQSQAGILRLALDTETTGTENHLAATAGQVGGAKQAAAIANAGVATVTGNVTALTTRVTNAESSITGIDTRVTTLEGSSGGGTGTVTIDPSGGLQETSSGLGVKVSGAIQLTSGYVTVRSAGNTQLGVVRSLAPASFYTGVGYIATEYVPSGTAHQALFDRVTVVEGSLGDISTALAAFLRI